MGYRRERPSGQTLASVLVATTLSGMVILSVASSFKFLFRGAQSLGAKEDRSGLKQFILAEFSNIGNCSCQLDNSQNVMPGGQPFVDTTAAVTPDIPLGTLRSGCNFSVTNNIIAQDGQPLPGAQGGLSVDKVTVTSIIPTGTANQYSGILQITFNSSSGLLFPVRVPILFLIDSSRGSPSSRPIQRCLGSAGPSNIFFGPQVFLNATSPSTCNAQYNTTSAPVLYEGQSVCPAGSTVIAGMVSCPNGTLANSIAAGTSAWTGDCCSLAGTTTHYVQAICMRN